MEANIKINGITCIGCVNRIDTRLKNLGVLRFDIDFQTSIAHVIYETDDVAPTEILDEIIDLGYQAYYV